MIISITSVSSLSSFLQLCQFTLEGRYVELDNVDFFHTRGGLGQFESVEKRVFFCAFCAFMPFFDPFLTQNCW